MNATKNFIDKEKCSTCVTTNVYIVLIFSALHRGPEIVTDLGLAHLSYRNEQKQILLTNE